MHRRPGFRGRATKRGRDSKSRHPNFVVLFHAPGRRYLVGMCWSVESLATFNLTAKLNRFAVVHTVDSLWEQQRTGLRPGAWKMGNCLSSKNHPSGWFFLGVTTLKRQAPCATAWCEPDRSNRTKQIGLGSMQLSSTKTRENAVALKIQLPIQSELVLSDDPVRRSKEHLLKIRISN